MKLPSTGEDICIMHTLKVNYKDKHKMFSQLLDLDFASFRFVTVGAPEEVYCGRIIYAACLIEIIWKLYLLTLLYKTYR
jgi:hypothetical protein